tara:strand:+ start:492 stop:1154 length:663 start_codon:yes stop_codon:yes gene_type:complete
LDEDEVGSSTIGLKQPSRTSNIGLHHAKVDGIWRQVDPIHVHSCGYIADCAYNVNDMKHTVYGVDFKNKTNTYIGEHSPEADSPYIVEIEHALGLGSMKANLVNGKVPMEGKEYRVTLKGQNKTSKLTLRGALRHIINAGVIKGAENAVCGEEQATKLASKALVVYNSLEEAKAAIEGGGNSMITLIGMLNSLKGGEDTRLDNARWLSCCEKSGRPFFDF